jgi:hypothetical protein
LRYVSYDGPAFAINGHPIWPQFPKGQIALFPLAAANEESVVWSLTADEGMNVTVPALQHEWHEGHAPATARHFILHELTNTLANAPAKQRYDAAVYIRELH